MVVFKDAKKLSDKQLFFGSLYSFICCGIYVKLLILNKLYFNLLIILGSQKGAPIGAQKLAPGSQKGAPIGA